MTDERNIEWSHGMDVALVKSFIGCEQHNFFVFCRSYQIYVKEAFARHAYLMEDSKRYKTLREEAQGIYDSERGQRVLNSEILKKILEKGAPANAVDREWLAMNEW